MNVFVSWLNTAIVTVYWFLHLIRNSTKIVRFNFTKHIYHIYLISFSCPLSWPIFLEYRYQNTFVKNHMHFVLYYTFAGRNMLNIIFCVNIWTTIMYTIYVRPTSLLAISVRTPVHIYYTIQSAWTTTPWPNCQSFRPSFMHRKCIFQGLPYTLRALVVKTLTPLIHFIWYT